MTKRAAQTPATTPVVTIERVDALALNEQNPRVISKPRFEQLKRSLVNDPQMMHARPLIATTTGVVIAGNMRLRAARELGWETIPVVRVELDDAQAKLWLLRDNQSYGDWHDEQLAELLYTLHEAGADLDLSGFDESETAKLLESVSGPIAPELFESFDADMETQHKCPKCNYEWSGKSS